MKKLFLLSAIIFLGLILSCAKTISSNDVPVEKILRHYSAYRSDGGTTWVSAEFLAEAGITIAPQRDPFGQQVTLEGKSKIFFNGREMEYDKNIWGEVAYRLKFDKWPQKFSWKWIDKNGKEHTDSAEMDSDHLDGGSLVTKGNDYIVEWKGSPIMKHEEVAVFVRGRDEDFYQSSENVGAKKITVKGTGFHSLGMKISRIKKSAGCEGNFNRKSCGKFYYFEILQQIPLVA